MVKITDGRNILIVPVSAFNDYYKEMGWNLIAKKKTDSIIKKTETVAKIAENSEKVEKIENNKKNKRR